MKLSIKTSVLQDMVERSVKGAGMNKLIPITSLMAIQLKDKKLTLTTSDESNTLCIIQDNVDGDDFYAVVQVEQFAKLIQKLTSDSTTLSVEDSVLMVKANGIYKIELPLDENGDMVEYPVEDDIEGEGHEIPLSIVKTILSTNKAALAVTTETPCYTGYYVGDKVVTTDIYKICGLAAKLFDQPVLIAPQTMNLLDVMTDEKILVYMEEERIQFVTKNCVVYGSLMPDLADFDIDSINDLLEEEFESSCKISRNDLIALLERIDLFVGTYDNQSITLTFTEKGIDISSKKSNGIETIAYVESKNFKPYTCPIDISLLMQQVKANQSDLLNLQYGNDRSVKIVDGNITQVIALLEDE